jgi:NCS2 family nucleobase:cation symporter-2/xanthine permease XanP
VEKADHDSNLDEELLYPLEARPPLPQTLLVGLQHVLAMFAGIITPPLLVAKGALGFDAGQTTFFIGMALFASGLATWIQVRRIWRVGSGLLSVQGTSFTFIKPAFQAGKAGGLPLVLGMSLLGAPAEILVSLAIAWLRRIFPPLVSGTAVLLIGLSLIKVGMTNVGGGFGAKDFGAPVHLGLALLVLVVIVLLNRLGRGLLKAGAVMIGIACGYLAAAALGQIDLSSVASAGWYVLPIPLRYGITFDPMHFLPWFLAYLITSIETVGDLTATSVVSRQPISGELYRSRLAGGTLADALGSIIAALFNSLPNTTFSQNNGVIQITGVASRRVGYAVAGILVLLGLCPKIGSLVSAMPPAVLGGATLALFGMVAAAGIRILAMTPLGGRELLILAVSIGVGLGIEVVPEVLSQLPELLRITLGTGLVTGTLVALVLNLVFGSAVRRS